MRGTKYILALVVSGLALLTGAQGDVVVAQAEPVAKPVVQANPVAKPVARAKTAAAIKPKVKRPIQLDLKEVVNPPAVVAAPAPAPKRESAPPVKKGPHVDMEGLLIGDMHIQPNLILSTDTRYENANTRERAQRDDLDLIAARRHGNSTRSPNPIDDMIRARAKPPATPGTPGSNDPGYDVAVAVREQIDIIPPKPATTPVAAAAPVPTPAPAPASHAASRPARQPSVTKLAPK